MFAKRMVMLSCVIAGCAEPGPADSWTAGGLYDIEPQGHSLLGASFDVAPFAGGAYYFNLDRATKGSVPVTLDVVNDAALHSGSHVGIDPWFNGVIVSNGTSDLQLTIVSGNATEAHYQLTRRSTGSAFDTVVCGEAIPLAGVFQADGLHVPMTGRITWSCVDGVVAKCTRWGYPAGSAPGLRWNAHQACTRMARADYCANGNSHTRNETSILIADSVPGVNDLPVDGIFASIVDWPPDPNKYYFEAAWWPGAHAAGCLSKVRWQSLPIGGLCAALPDPRHDPLARDCEDLVVDDLVTAGALTFVGTAYNDLALNRWHAATADGTDYVTTVRGYNAELGSSLLAPPFPEYHSYTFDGIDGFLLRKVPGSITNPADLIEVSLFREIGNDRFVLAASDAPRFSTAAYMRWPEREGYVFSWQRPGSVAFGLYFNRATGDYLSTVGTVLPAGYVWVENIGWIMPPEPTAP